MDDTRRSSRLPASQDHRSRACYFDRHGDCYGQCGSAIEPCSRKCQCDCHTAGYQPLPAEQRYGVDAPLAEGDGT